MIRKLVINNGRSERELLLVGSIVIGRDPACHVSEPDPLLSRRHAEILANVHGVSIRDLNSRNGILVNGEKTREQLLFPGDVVQMGHLQLRYVEEHARQGDTTVERSPVRRPLPPEPAAPAAPKSLGESVFDRYRVEPSQTPGRWRPEPTPLPGRKSSAPPPPPPRTRYPQAPTPVPRGRAAFPDAAPPPVRQPDPFEETIAARSPLAQDRTQIAPPAAFDDRGFSDAFDQTVAASGAGSRRAADDTVAASAKGLDTTLGPGHAAFDSAIAHLSEFAAPGPHDPAPSVEAAAGSEATVVANADLTITHATPECAELLGVPGDQLIGDSLPDVFLRAVRRAYAQPDLAVSLSIARGSHGSITVTFFLQQTGGTE